MPCGTRAASSTISPKHLGGTGNEVTLTLEIDARSGGYDTRTPRVVKENATQLGFESHEFEH